MSSNTLRHIWYTISARSWTAPQDYIKICTDSHQLDIFSQRQYIVKNVSLHAGLQLIYGLSPRFCQSVLNGIYGNGMTGVTKNLPAQTSQ